MPGPRRLRRTRRVALAVGIALALATVLSPWYAITIRGTRWVATLSNGGLRMQWFVGAEFTQFAGVDVGLADETQRRYSWRWSCNHGSWVRSAWLPGWIPLAGLFVPIGLVWGIACLPARRGRCRSCGYDLTGVTSDASGLRCPECGEERNREVGRKTRHARRCALRRTARDPRSR